MPTLNIATEMLNHPLTLAYLQPVMLWPNDENENERTEWMCTAIINFSTQPEMVDGMNRSQLVALLDLAKDAAPAQSIEARANPLYEKAFFAGEFLVAAIQHFNKFGWVQLDAITKADIVADKRRATHRVLDFKKSTLDHAIWAPYRAVAHLWGAHAYASLIENDDAFPCRADRIPYFLSMAAWLARQATAIPRTRNKGTLLDAKQIWTVPPELDLVDLGLTDQETAAT